MSPHAPSFCPVKERLADWLGLNRATIAVLAVIGSLGLSEEIWSNFLSLHLKDQVGVLQAAAYMGVFASAKNLLEGFAYILGGSAAHHLGARAALAISAAPMALGFAVLLIYLVLAAQFKSFRDPMIVLLGSVPLAISGALLFSFLDLTTINIYSQVGLITLVGLIAKNGIPRHVLTRIAHHIAQSPSDRKGSRSVIHPAW